MERCLRFLVPLVLGHGISGCVDEGRGLAWPDVDAVLAFVYADDGTGTLRSLSGPLTSSDGGTWDESRGLSASVSPDESLVAIFLDVPALLEVHPLVDLDRLSEARLVADDPVCAEQLFADGHVQARVPVDALVYEDMEGRLQPSASPGPIIERAGRLSLALSNRRCESGLVARRFGSDWSVFAERFERDGEVFLRGQREDDHMFRINGADYLDDDRVVISAQHGLAVLERGEILSDDAGPFYWSVYQFPEHDADSLGFQSVLLIPRAAPLGVSRVITTAAFESNGREGSRVGVFDIDESGIRLVASTSIAGNVDDFRLDADGRAVGLVRGDDAGELTGRLLLTYRDGDTFDRWTVPRALRYVEATGISSPKHLALTSVGTLIAGDLSDPPRWTTVSMDEDGVGLYRGLSAVSDGEKTWVALGRDGGGMLLYELGGGPQPIPLFLDDGAQASGCEGAATACGYPTFVAGELRFWLALGELGPTVAVVPGNCTSVFASQAELGCFGVLGVGQVPLLPEHTYPLAGIFRRTTRDRALVAGSSGTLFELLLGRAGP